MNFSQCTLSEAREHLDKTQQEMAEFLGISRNYVSMIEGGKKPFSDKLRRRLERAVSLPVSKVPVTCAHSFGDLREDPEKPYAAPPGASGCPHCRAKDTEIEWLRETVRRLQDNFKEALAALKEKGAKHE